MVFDTILFFVGLVVVWHASIVAHELGHTAMIYYYTRQTPKIRIGWWTAQAGTEGEALDLSLSRHVWMSAAGPFCQLAFILVVFFVSSMPVMYLQLFAIFTVIGSAGDIVNIYYALTQRKQHGDIQTGVANKKTLENELQRLKEQGY